MNITRCKNNVKISKIRKNNGGVSMSTFANIKPLQATPELKGNDARRFIQQACSMPKNEDIQKNKSLLSILKRVQK